MTQALDRPLISVALPIRNGMPHLKNAMKGLMVQTYTNFELVVQDCLSADGAVEYLQSLDTKFPIRIVTEQDHSLADGYSRAFERCQGDLVVIAACDEYFDADAFAKYVSWYKANPDAVLIYGGSRLVDSEGKALSVFKSAPFDLLDYARHIMCPTQAGIYNRGILGADLHYDREMPMCPDYDLLIRMALKYGPNRLRYVDDVTMSARADDASMSFQPELFPKFWAYKMKAVERMLTGPYADLYQDFARRDFAFRIALANAHIAHSISGDTPQFRELAMRANDALPGHHLLPKLAEQSHGLVWSGPAIGLEAREKIDRAPDEAQTVFTAGPETVASMPYWLNTGAALEPVDGGMKVITPPSDCSYAAIIPLDLSTVDRRAQCLWVRLTVREVDGEVLCGLYDAATNEVELEQLLPARTDRQVYEIELWRPVGSAVLLRTGRSGAPGSVVVEGVEVKALDKARALTIAGG